jgi:hypothetical protein
MAHAAGDSHEYPIYGAHFRVVFPIFDADGDLVTGATGLDSERSIDMGAFADCTNEATEIATSSGMYYLDLTGAEMTGNAITVIVKTTTVGAKTTPITLYPRHTFAVETGTAAAGAASTITLPAPSSTVNDAYNGLYILITNNTPAGAQYQARRIIDYVGSTKVATVESAWGTNPSSSSTYEILVPDVMGVSAWMGTKIPAPTNPGFPLVDLAIWNSAAVPNNLISGRVDASVGAVAANAITDAGVAADMDSYAAKLWMNKEGADVDKYGCVWFKNGQPVLSGVTSPTIQVFKASDGTDLIAVTAMTEVGSHHVFKKEETTNKTAPGDMYWAKVQATIDGSTRTWLQPVPRDSA